MKPWGESQGRVRDDAHCLTQIVTLRKWLSQLKCYLNSGGSHVGRGISKMAKQQLVATIRDRYQQASKKDNGRILDEFTAITGHHRKHGIRLLSGTSSTDGKRGSSASTTRPHARRSSLSGRPLTVSAGSDSRWRCPTSWTPRSQIPVRTYNDWNWPL